VFESRAAHVREVCRTENKLVPENLATSNVPGRMYIEPRHGILYCPVEKVASTLWKNTLTAIQNYDRFKSPFQVKLFSTTKLYSVQEYFQRHPNFDINEMNKDADSLLVVRDPYRRLFSAYLDKLYHPNWLFWKRYGEMIKLEIRKYKNPNSNLVCGNDITFPEFVEFVVQNFETQHIALDPHFTSIHAHCDPCRTHFKYIVKTETLKNDYSFIMDKWMHKFRLNLTNYKDFEVESVLDRINTHVRISFSTMRDYGTKCNIPAYVFHERTWRYFQLNGVIPMDAKLPFARDMSGFQVSMEEYEKAITKEYVKTRRDPETTRQKERALVLAYSAISDENMARLKQAFSHDCIYFGYNCNPPTLVGLNTSITASEDQTERLNTLLLPNTWFFLSKTLDTYVYDYGI